MGKRRVACCACALLLLSAKAQAEEKEPSLTFEMGGAAGWGLHGGSSAGPEIGFAYTVIEHWLEIEASTTPQFSRGLAEFDSDLIFKKPFELTDRFEFLIGAGPLWLKKPDADSIAAEVTADFIYEAWPEQHAAIFVEPSYSYDFGKGHEQTLGFTAGLHIGLQ